MTTYQWIGLGLVSGTLLALFMPMILQDWRMFLVVVSLSLAATAGVVGGLYLLTGGQP